MGYGQWPYPIFLEQKMSKDRNQPLKLEDPSTGGTETDWGPTSMDPHEDYVDAHGLTIQSETSNDEDVFIGRDTATADMLFQDGVAGGPYTLHTLLTGAFNLDNFLFDLAGSIVYANDETVITKV